MKTFTAEDIKKSKVAHLNPHIGAAPVKEKKKHKFGATATTVDDITFDSVKEAKRYKELKWQLKVGLIGFLKLQVPFELNPGGAFSFIYIADFTYIEQGSGKLVVNDAKGFKTVEYKKKKRLMKKIHGIEIFET